MFPVIIEISGFPVHTYGVLMALAFGAGLAVAVQLGRGAGLESDRVGDLAIIALVAGLVGARLMYVAVEWDQFHDNLSSIVMRRDGFVFFGGLILAFPAAFAYVRWKKMDFWKTADVFAPALALGHSIGRLGCFAQGCCFGGPFPYGLLFPEDSPPSLRFDHVPVHPSQLYESLLLLALFGWLLTLRTKKPFEGAVALQYLMAYSVIRFLLEFLRADDRGFYLGPLSVSQLISLALLVPGLLFYLRMRSAQRPG